MEGLRTALLCLQSLVSSEGHHKRGTLMQLNPKTRKIQGKRAAFPARENIQRSVLGLLSQPRGIHNSLRATLGYCTWQLQGAPDLPLPRSRGSEPPLPSPTASICPREPGEEPGAARAGWGGSTPGGRVHQKGEAAALEDSALQDWDSFTLGKS